MTSPQAGNTGAQDPMRAGAQMWEAGYRSLTESMAQTQEFWNSIARGWGDTAGAWMGRLSQAGQGVSGENMAVLRELQESAFAVGQAWMRLPLVLMGGAQPAEMQEAFSRLTEAQGHAYQLWLGALTQRDGTQ